MKPPNRTTRPPRPRSFGPAGLGELHGPDWHPALRVVRRGRLPRAAAQELAGEAFDQPALEADVCAARRDRFAEVLRAVLPASALAAMIAQGVATADISLCIGELHARLLDPGVFE